MTPPLLIWTALAVVVLGYVLVAPAGLNLGRFVGRLRVQCPQRHQATWIKVNPLSAAISAPYGHAHTHVRACGLLGHNDRCGEECLRDLQ